MVEETENNNNELADLQDVWQDTPPVDMQNMAKKARFVWWRMRINFAMEVILSLVGLGVLAVMIDFSSVAATSFGLVASLYCIGALWAAFHIRKGAWGEAGEDALSLVRLQIKRANSSILYVKLNTYFGYAGLGIIAFGYWFLYEKHGSLTLDRLMIVHWIFGLMALILIIFPIVLRPYVRGKEKEIAKLEELAAELEQD